MHCETFSNAAEFLDQVQSVLEENEAVNNLMYGLALRARGDPEAFIPPLYFAAVHSGGHLLAAAMMTPPHNLIVFSTVPDAAAALDCIAENLLAQGWVVPGVLGPSATALAFAGVWHARTGSTHSLSLHERVYELRAVTLPRQPDGHMRLATLADTELLIQWELAFHHEAVPDDLLTLDDLRKNVAAKIVSQDLFLWDDAPGQAVCMAAIARTTPNGGVIGPVYTPVESRRKGYASALTAALSQVILDRGKKFACLFTDLANPTSNSIYKKIGYQPLCDFDVYKFS